MNPEPATASAAAQIWPTLLPGWFSPISLAAFCFWCCSNSSAPIKNRSSVFSPESFSRSVHRRFGCGMVLAKIEPHRQHQHSRFTLDFAAFARRGLYFFARRRRLPGHGIPRSLGNGFRRHSRWSLVVRPESKNKTSAHHLPAPGFPYCRRFDLWFAYDQCGDGRARDSCAARKSLAACVSVPGNSRSTNLLDFPAWSPISNQDNQRRQFRRGGSPVHFQ